MGGMQSQESRGNNVGGVQSQECRRSVGGTV